MDTDAAIAKPANPPVAASPLEKSVDLAVDLAALRKDVALRLRQYGKNLKLPGFRPGKVPETVLRQHFGEKAESEALTEALQHNLQAALSEREMRLAGVRRLVPKESSDSTRLAFSAVFEVYPEVTLRDLAGLAIEIPVFEVGAEDVDATIEVLRKQRARYEAVERPAAAGDRMTVDFVGMRDDGGPFPGGQAQDFRFLLGAGTMISDFENAVTGTVAGESKHFAMTFPADYFLSELAGKLVRFDLTVKQVEQTIVPEADSELARALGIDDGDLDRMRAEVESNLKREVKKRLRARLAASVMDTLLAAHPIDVPRVLVENETQRLLALASQDFERRGVKVGESTPLQTGWFEQTAKRRVALGLILGALVEKQHLEARPEQVRELIDEAAQSYEHPHELMTWFYAKKERRSEFENLATENNIVAWVLARAQTTQKPLTFAEVMRVVV